LKPILRPSQKQRRALKEFHIAGLATVLPFHRAVLESPDFTAETGFKVHTRWIETDFKAIPEATPRPAPIDDASVLRTHIEIDGKRHELAIPRILFSGAAIAQGSSAGGTTETQEVDASAITAPVSGTVQSWKVNDGTAIKEGDLIATMEAMKMETQIVSPQSGTIKIAVAAGTYVDAGTILAKFT
jgi:acetyl-CoA/propionyl-CoA carboxylase biotin carboxyl carrier protein